jgi:hypothetical protein
MVTPRRWVEAAPAGRPLPYGLLSLPGVVVPDADPHTGLGGIEYQTTACAPAAALSVEECAAIADLDELTDDDGFDRISGDPFVVYALHRCRNVGLTQQSVDAAREKLTLGAGRAIESHLAGLAAADADDITPTPGTGVSIETGLGLLEEHAGDVYAKSPVIHATRGSATSAAAKGLIVDQGGHLETKLGSSFVAGAGYTSLDTVDAVTADAGERWMFVTGTVLVQQGDVKEAGPVYGLSAPDNEQIALAQQSHTLSYECLLAAVLVTFPGGG